MIESWGIEKSPMVGDGWNRLIVRPSSLVLSLRIIDWQKSERMFNYKHKCFHFVNQTCSSCHFGGWNTRGNPKDTALWNACCSFKLFNYFLYGIILVARCSVIVGCVDVRCWMYHLSLPPLARAIGLRRRRGVLSFSPIYYHHFRLP